MKFYVGDVVKWKSQANGGWKEKIGKVERIVPPKEMPYLAGSGFPRDHESYIVSVEIGKRVKRNKMYWPRVAALELIAGGQ